MTDDVAEPVESLGSIGKRVSIRFETLDKGNLPDEDGSRITNEQQRFELWAVNLGLYHGGHSSLDYRFRDSPPLLKYAYKLMRDLEKGLADVKAIFDGTLSETEPEDDDSEEDFSSYQTVSLSKAHVNNVTISVDRLYRLSSKIRNPAMRFGLSKALKYQEVDADTGVNLFDGFALLDKKHIVELFQFYGRQGPDALDDDYLVSRLARANTRRRQQFRYWERRRTKFQMYSKPIVSKSKSGNDGGIAMKRDDNPINKSHLGLSQPSTVTYLNADQMRLEDAVSVISTKTYLAIENENSDDRCALPPPPFVSTDAKEFECPFCFTICPRAILAKTDWETHIFRDLRPYVCTFEACKEPDQQYDTLTDWIAHEASNHGIPLDHQIGRQGNVRDCPICSIPNASSIHVACHLRRISCFSLPQLPGESENAAFGSELSRQAGFITHASDRSSLESAHWETWSENPSTAREPSNTVEIEALDIPTSEGLTYRERGQDDTIAILQTTTKPDQAQPDKEDPNDRLGLCLASQFELTSVMGSDFLNNMVYSGVDINTNAHYAVKALSKFNLSPRQNSLQHRGIRLHYKASNHSNVAQLIRILDAPDCMYAFMESFPEGDLFESVMEKDMYVGNDALVRQVFVQLLDAVHHCHNLGVYHFNIQAESIFVADQGKKIKLSGFELATDSIWSTAFNYKRNFYVSPESLQPDSELGKYASIPHDIWSLGVILINLTCGRNPWKLATAEDPTYKAYLNDLYFLKTILPLSDEVLFILNCIFQSDPENRISIPELRNLVLNCPSFTVPPAVWPPMPADNLDSLGHGT